MAGRICSRSALRRRGAARGGDNGAGGTFVGSAQAARGGEDAHSIGFPSVLPFTLFIASFIASSLFSFFPSSLYPFFGFFTASQSSQLLRAHHQEWAKSQTVDD